MLQQDRSKYPSITNCWGISHTPDIGQQFVVGSLVKLTLPADLTLFYPPFDFATM
jgi:hypothetical protein